jgi:hypothetical protein
VVAPPVARPQVLDKASAEIADIDSRLLALQEFLAAAKGTKPSESTAVLQ